MKHGVKERRAEGGLWQLLQGERGFSAARVEGHVGTTEQWKNGREERGMPQASERARMTPYTRNEPHIGSSIAETRRAPRGTCTHMRTHLRPCAMHAMNPTTATTTKTTTHVRHKSKAERNRKKGAHSRDHVDTAPKKKWRINARQ